MNNQVEEVKNKTDIVSIISEHVVLNKAGANYKGRCPFHNEKTASFMVSPELQIFKCFGCSEGGDVFSFLQKYEGMEFGEALKFLAEKAGIKLQNNFSQPNSEKEILYEINKLAAKFYHYLLTDHEVGKIGLEYLAAKRKLTKDTINTFQLGFAPESGQALVNFLIKKKFKPADLVKAGVAINARGGYLDRFRGRVIFPIWDHRGEVIALAGRILPQYDKGDMGKYINSPETLIYHKGSVLYGLNITRSEIKKAGNCLVVEGEVDLISSYQAGVKNVVAIKGSALTENQSRLLSRYTKEVILALDSDFAGGEAARRGISILSELGFDIKVLQLGEYKDPDDAATSNPAGYKKLLTKTIGIWDFLINLIFGKHRSTSGFDKGKVSREVVPILSSINDKIVQAHYINLVANKLGVPVEAVAQEVEKKDQKVSAPEVATNTPAKPKSRKEILVEKLFTLLFQKNPKLLLIPEINKFITSGISKKIISEIQAFSSEKEKFDVSGFVQQIPPELKEKVGDLIFQQIDDEVELKRELNMTWKELMTLDSKERIVNSLQKIAQVEKTEDKKTLEKLQQDYKKLSRADVGFPEFDFGRIIDES